MSYDQYGGFSLATFPALCGWPKNPSLTNMVDTVPMFDKREFDIFLEFADGSTVCSQPCVRCKTRSGTRTRWRVKGPENISSGAMTSRSPALIRRSRRSCIRP